MLIDKNLILSLLEEAKTNPRLRTNLDLRTSAEDSSQRMINAMVPGTVVPIHRHRKSTETVVCIYGSLTEIFYDENGVECGRFELNPTEENFGLQIPLGQWHTVVVKEPCVILETKDGPYEPLTSADVWNYE